MSRFVLFVSVYFFFNAPSTTELYTLSLHDALPIYTVEACVRIGRRHAAHRRGSRRIQHQFGTRVTNRKAKNGTRFRSEEHTSELQSLRHLVCRLLLEKKKKRTTQNRHTQHR